MLPDISHLLKNNINQLSMNEYRNCFDDIDGNCPYASFNKYNNPICSLDRIVGVRWFGCTPQRIIDKIDNLEKD